MGRVLGSAGWIFVPGVGAWMLFTSQLNCSEAFVRQTTELLWHTSPGLRGRCGDDIRRLYYAILAALLVWTAVLLGLGDPLNLVMLSANAAGVVFVVAGVQLLWLGGRLLPAALRPGLLTRATLAPMVVFYAVFSTLSIAAEIRG